MIFGERVGRTGSLLFAYSGVLNVEQLKKNNDF